MGSKARDRRGVSAAQSLRVAFLHPDLGLGGAERLVVDAAVELRSRGHDVDMFTCYHNPSRCFEETMAGHFNVIMAGGWFPRFICGRLAVPCAWVRSILAALYLIYLYCLCGCCYQVSVLPLGCVTARYASVYMLHTYLYKWDGKLNL